MEFKELNIAIPDLNPFQCIKEELDIKKEGEDLDSTEVDSTQNKKFLKNGLYSSVNVKEEPIDLKGNESSTGAINPIFLKCMHDEDTAEKKPTIKEEPLDEMDMKIDSLGTINSLWIEQPVRGSLQIPRVPDVDKMAAPTVCCMHLLPDEGGKISPFSDVSWLKFIGCLKIWVHLDGREKEISQSFAHFNEDSKRPSELGYHRRCYSRFTDKTKISRAEKRLEKAKIGLGHVGEETTQSEIEQQLSKTTRSKIRHLEGKSRSTMSTSVGPDQEPKPTPSGLRKSDHVLPPQCIMCSKDKFTLNKATRKRQKERLSLYKCQTGGLLIKAAELRNDERILLQTRGRDIVAIEVRYHRSCYKAYTNFMFRQKKE